MRNSKGFLLLFSKKKTFLPLTRLNRWDQQTAHHPVMQRDTPWAGCDHCQPR
jgi:hypothetical protein